MGMFSWVGGCFTDAIFRHVGRRASEPISKGGSLIPHQDETLFVVAALKYKAMGSRFDSNNAALRYAKRGRDRCRHGGAERQ
jgi:hypothetical protein